jgi:hypothetical protein
MATVMSLPGFSAEASLTAPRAGAVRLSTSSIGVSPQQCVYSGSCAYGNAECNGPCVYCPDSFGEYGLAVCCGVGTTPLCVGSLYYCC